MNFLIIFILVLFGIVGFSYVFIKLYEKMLFIVDKDNPFRRVCSECGQIQEEFGEYYDSTMKGYWETIGPILNKECVCNFYTRDGWKHFS